MKLPERYERLVLGALIGTVVSLAVYIAGIRKATRERTHVVAEEEFCGRVECKPSPAARFSSANHFVMDEKSETDSGNWHTGTGFPGRYHRVTIFWGLRTLPLKLCSSSDRCRTRAALTLRLWLLHNTIIHISHSGQVLLKLKFYWESTLIFFSLCAFA